MIVVFVIEVAVFIVIVSIIVFMGIIILVDLNHDFRKHKNSKRNSKYNKKKIHKRR